MIRLRQVSLNEFLRYGIAGVLTVFAIGNLGIVAKSLESSHPLPYVDNVQYYALAVAFSIVIAMNEKPLIGFLIIVLSFIPYIQATPVLLWLSYKIMIHDSPISLDSSIERSSISSNDIELSYISPPAYDPNLFTSLRTSQAPTSWMSSSFC